MAVAGGTQVRPKQNPAYRPAGDYFLLCGGSAPHPNPLPADAMHRFAMGGSGSLPLPHRAAAGFQRWLECGGEAGDTGVDIFFR